MIVSINDCNGCEDCTHCGKNRYREAYACDSCGETAEHLYWWADEIYCIGCLKELEAYRDEAVETYVYLKDSGIEEVSQ